MKEMNEQNQNIIEMNPIGFVSRTSPTENERDRSFIARIILEEHLGPALDGIEEWSHIYVIFWLDKAISSVESGFYRHSSGIGIFAARSPIHPNPIGLTLVELIKRDGNVLWVRGLDALHGTPVIDIKPYPDWERGKLIVVTDYKIPGWLKKIINGRE